MQFIFTYYILFSSVNAILLFNSQNRQKNILISTDKDIELGQNLRPHHYDVPFSNAEYPHQFLSNLTSDRYSTEKDETYTLWMYNQCRSKMRISSDWQLDDTNLVLKHECHESLTILGTSWR